MFDDKTPLLKEIWRYFSVEKERKWLTNTQLAEKVWSTQWYISTVLNGKASISIEKLSEIALTGLGISRSTFDAKVQEITRKLVGVGESDSDPYSLLAKDGVKPEDIEKVKDFVQFIKSKY